MDSEMSSCCCFLLRLLILVQKTAHARGAVREPPDLQLVRHLTFEKHYFLNQILERICSHKLHLLAENAPQKVLKIVPKIDFFPKP